MHPDSQNNRAVIGVGSNLDPEGHISTARSEMIKSHRLLSASRFVTTKPVGYADQPDFVNGAWLIQTDWKQEKLVRWLHALEDRLGRVRTANRNGPRTIDLDLVVWNGRIIDPDVYTRQFLKQAVIEVCPELRAHFSTFP